MKNKLTTLTLAAALASVSPLTASYAYPNIPSPNGYSNPSSGYSHSGMYFGVHGGGSLPTNIFLLDPGFDVGANLGYQSGPFRIEGAATYYNNSITIPFTSTSAGNLELFTLMANGYYDFFAGHRFTPYIGGGIGWLHGIAKASVNIGGVGASISTNQFAYQGIAGLAFHINKQVSIAAEYHILAYTNNGGGFYNIVNGELTYHFG